MWQGLQTITNYKGKPSHEVPSDASLPDELNAFYARFEASNTEPCMRAIAVPDDCVISLSVANVLVLYFLRTNVSFWRYKVGGNLENRCGNVLQLKSTTKYTMQCSLSMGYLGR